MAYTTLYPPLDPQFQYSFTRTFPLIFLRTYSQSSVFLITIATTSFRFSCPSPFLVKAVWQLESTHTRARLWMNKKFVQSRQSYQMQLYCSSVLSFMWISNKTGHFFLYSCVYLIITMSNLNIIWTKMIKYTTLQFKRIIIWKVRSTFQLLMDIFIHYSPADRILIPTTYYY